MSNLPNPDDLALGRFIASLTEEESKVLVEAIKKRHAETVSAVLSGELVLTWDIDQDRKLIGDWHDQHTA